MRYDNGISTREEAYWFGFLMGDGNLSRYRNRIQVALIEEDIGHLGKLRLFFDDGYIRPFGDGYIQYTIERKPLADNLRALGFVPNKSHLLDESIIPEVHVMDFVRGLLDADGTVYLRLPYACIKFNGTFRLMRGIKNILTMYMPVGNIYQDDTNFVLSVGGRHKTEQLSRLIWDHPTVFLHRKYQKVLKLYEYNDRNPAKRKVKSIR